MQAGRELTTAGMVKLAKLFYDSGWTQQELADKEGKCHQWISQQLRFGRFVLWNSTSGRISETLPKNLTERRFRSYWEQASGTKDTARFRQVWKMMQDETHVIRPREEVRELITKKELPEILS